MTFALASQFHVYLPLGQRQFNSVFIVGAFSMIVQNNCETDESSVALLKTSLSTPALARPVEQQIVNLSILFQIIFEGGSKYL